MDKIIIQTNINNPQTNDNWYYAHILVALMLEKHFITNTGSTRLISGVETMWNLKAGEFMAKRIYFLATQDAQSAYAEESCDFQFYTGFSVSQKQKSIISFHEKIILLHPGTRTLEISTKSLSPIGVQLSAFNLMFTYEKSGQQFPIENVFQASKVFQNGGPYRDLLYKAPYEAKKDLRLSNSGEIKGFFYNNQLWELEPKSMFYDWLYLLALIENPNLSNKLLDYEIFTDIEFNHNKSFSCQARSAAIFVSLTKRGELSKYHSNIEIFKTLYQTIESQMSIIE